MRQLLLLLLLLLLVLGHGHIAAPASLTPCSAPLPFVSQ
jgi:hypothetical protein